MIDIYLRNLLQNARAGRQAHRGGDRGRRRQGAQGAQQPAGVEARQVQHQRLAESESRLVNPAALSTPSTTHARATNAFCTVYFCSFRAVSPYSIEILFLCLFGGIS